MKTWKILIVILFILSGALFGFALVTFLGKQAETTLRIQTEDNLIQQKFENKKLNLAYEELTQTKNNLETTLKNEKKRAQEIMTAFNKEKKARTQAEKNHKQSAAELNRFKKEYQELSQELEVLQQKIQDLGFGDSELALKASPGKMVTEIEIPPVVVSAGSPQEGQVLVVNRDFNFVVVDKGSNDGVAKGEFLSIFRSGKPVAKVQAEKVYDQFSACGIIEESKSRPVREGDLVKKS